MKKSQPRITRITRIKKGESEQGCRSSLLLRLCFCYPCHPCHPWLRISRAGVIGGITRVALATCSHPAPILNVQQFDGRRSDRYGREIALAADEDEVPHAVSEGGNGGLSVATEPGGLADEVQRAQRGYRRIAEWQTALDPLTVNTKRV